MKETTKIFQEVMKTLRSTWTFAEVEKVGREERNLIYTYYMNYRRDNRISHRICNVKFKFKIGNGMFSTDSPPRFCISLLKKRYRVVWVADHNGWNGFWIKSGGKRLFKVPEYLIPENVTDEDVEDLERMCPGLVSNVIQLKPGLEKIRGELKERFRGIYS